MEADATTGESELESLEKVQQKRELKFEEKVLMTVLSWQKQVEQTERKKTLDELQSQFQAKAAMVASWKHNIYNVSKILVVNNVLKQ